MTMHPLNAVAQPKQQSPSSPQSRWSLLAWFASYGTLTVPQAAGPVAFSLIALALTGDTSGGAAMILAMTVAQIFGAVPITRQGSRFPVVPLLRALVCFRAAALVLMAAAALWQAPFAVLVALAALSGAVNGAAYGYLRALLNHLAPASHLPRALGIAATLNEVAFVLAPVVASGLGSVSPVFGLVVIAFLGAIPALLIPNVTAVEVEKTAKVKASVLTPEIVLWLCCAIIDGAVVAAIEIGAVSMAIEFGFAPTMAILFTVPLCLASVTGGVWVSWRNRKSSQIAVVLQFAAMSLGISLVAGGTSLTMTIAGTVIVGLVLAPLSTYFSLALDALSPPSRRPEVFALLRSANGIGVIIASTILALASVQAALVAVAALILALTFLVAFWFARRAFI